MTETTSEWTSGWYVVKTDTNMESVSITGNATLLLMDGSHLNVKNNIEIEEQASLTIYAQSADASQMGTLTVEGSSLPYNGGAIQVNRNSTLTINGGPSSFLVHTIKMRVASVQVTPVP